VFTTYARKLSQRDGSPISPGFTPGGAPRSAAAPPTATGQPAARGGGAACDKPSYSHVPFYQVFDAAIDHLMVWVKDGKLPPSAPPIELSSVGPPAIMARDAAGNALGAFALRYPSR
jgi:Alpha/beta hydrolase domain